MSGNGFWWRLLLALLIIGALALGGAFLYQAGYAQGYQAAGLAEAASGETGQPLPYGSYAPFPMMGYGYPNFGFMPFFPFFGLLSCLVGVLLLFAIFGGMARFAGRRHWHAKYGMDGPWYRGQGSQDWANAPVPPWVRAMHERMHGEPAAGEAAGAEPADPAG